ncbi:TIGR03546 family protein [Reinekea marinisedimentorum]|uniref:Uncharacterized protein (TIGR03546 family) n=1 Tax=Reinekea marinisedimentorum TaxID=230495 RepID=A0A4R3I3Y5_9GAMM|nr:TIGR03546 family protein [Reinekea marinisedimentorum]TCS40004.1 uncharacterized protein (TIGR03546 family) [Reinekea marinisedimentorum]
MIQSILKIFKALNSDVGPWQIAFAAAMGMIIGLTPLWSVHNAIVLLLAFLLRVHLATFFVFWLLFSAIAYLLDPWFHQLGLSLLNNDSLESLWTSLYQQDFWQVLHFNHTITLGSFLVAIIAFVPFAVAMRLSIVRYRASLLPWVNKMKVVQMLKGSRLFQLYQSIEG